MSEKNNIGEVTYNAGVLGAKVKLTATSSKEGRILREGCSWELRSLDKDQLYTMEAAQHSMIVPAGTYAIHFIRDSSDNYGCLAQVKLEQNTSTDSVFIFEDSRVDDDYVADYDAKDDFSRRQQERDAQSLYGGATLPLRDPTAPSGDMGVQFMAHPLLQTTQFDGVPPEMRADPHENRDALQLTMENKLSAKASPTISPSR